MAFSACDSCVVRTGAWEYLLDICSRYVDIHRNFFTKFWKAGAAAIVGLAGTQPPWGSMLAVNFTLLNPASQVMNSNAAAGSEAPLGMMLKLPCPIVLGPPTVPGKGMTPKLPSRSEEHTS